MSKFLGAIDGWLLRRFGQYARSAGYAAFVSLLGLFAGLWGSLYADQIKAAVPFVMAQGPISWRATSFWVLALLATFLFFLAQHASDVQRQESEARLDRRSDELAKLVRTLPPADFLSTFRQIFWDCSVALSGIYDTPDTELNLSLVKRAVRVVLAGIATLAQKFDGASGDVRYAANIMLFKPSDQLDEQEIAEIIKILRFSPPETDIRALRGILELQLELSTTTQSRVPLEPDPDLIMLALAIPRIARDSRTKRWRALPGAPMAFCNDNLEAYVDTHTLGEWCRREGDFPESTAAEIENYFASVRAQNDRSFVSIPLKPFDGEPVGVLNIHRNQTGLLKEKEPVQQFTPLVSPFIFILIRLLDVMNGLER